MAVDLAVTLVALAAGQAVRQLVNGHTPANEDWAGVAGEVVHALITHTSGQSMMHNQSATLARIEQQGLALPAREYQQHMAAGRRFLHDLPVSWRTKADRTDIIREARSEFVRASAVAEEMGDVHRRVLAEVAIAGCWLWVPSLPDTKRTIGGALKILEEALLDGAGTGLVRPYIDVLRLCQEYGQELPAGRIATLAFSQDREVPVDPATVPTMPAVLTVNARINNLAYCFGVFVYVSNVSAGRPGGWSSVVVAVTNKTSGPVYVHLAAVRSPLASPATTQPAPSSRIVERILDKTYRTAAESVLPTSYPVAQGAHLGPTTLRTQPTVGANRLAVIVRLPPRRAGAVHGPTIAFLVPADTAADVVAIRPTLTGQSTRPDTAALLDSELTLARRGRGLDATPLPETPILAQISAIDADDPIHVARAKLVATFIRAAAPLPEDLKLIASAGFAFGQPRSGRLLDGRLSDVADELDRDTDTVGRWLDEAQHLLVERLLLEHASIEAAHDETSTEG